MSSKFRQNIEGRTSREELIDAGRFVLVVALLMIGLSWVRHDFPPGQSQLLKATGSPATYIIEDDPRKVRFALEGIDFVYSVDAGKVDDVICSLTEGGDTTVLYAPKKGLLSLLPNSGQTVWEVRHGGEIVRSYQDIVRSRDLNTLGITGIGGFFLLVGAGFLACARREAG